MLVGISQLQASLTMTRMEPMDCCKGDRVEEGAVIISDP